MKFLGIDIGGANIKVADADGYAATTPFALWREPERLAQVLSECLAVAPGHDAIAATTTGELADCFVTKRDGVRAIYSALAIAAVGRNVRVYLTDGSFVSLDDAIAAPQLAAASNWHALAAFAARYSTGRDGVLIDVGSTTTDIIPIHGGKVAARGHTDTERLLRGGLVYTGVTRTPVGMLVKELPWQGHSCPIAREQFATALDAHLILGNVAENSADTGTADGRPATRAAARDRLARMVGADRETFDEADAVVAAGAIATAQRRLVAEGLSRATAGLARWQVCILSGEGEFLARQVLDEMSSPVERISLTDCLGARISQAATAHALAVLANERSEASNSRPASVAAVAHP